MRLTKLLTGWCPLCLAALLSAGCGDGGPDLPEGPTGTVGGTVTYDGSPIPEGSSVVFHPVSEGVVASGIVDAEGRYELESRQQPQVLAGTYKVTISQPTEDVESTDEEAMREMYEGGGQPAPPPPFPEKYTSIAATDLEYTVEEGPNEIDITLED